jgi:hypothetical protein
VRFVCHSPVQAKLLYMLSFSTKQIVDGHLYRQPTTAYLRGEQPPYPHSGVFTVAAVEDLMLAALHLFDVPDMDFIMH